MTARPGKQEAGALARPDRGADHPELWREPLPRLPRYLVAAAAVLALLSIGLPNVAPGVEFMAAEGSPVRLFFGVAEEMNLPTFFSVLVAVAAAAALALVGRLVGGRTGMSFYVTGALLLAMAFDDFTALHERLDTVGEALVPPGTTGYLWVLPGLVPAAVVLLAFWRLGKDLQGPARRDLVLGVVVVLVAALGLESVNGLLDRPGTDGAPLQLVTHLEEFTESVGLILLLRGALRMLEVAGRSALSLRVAEGSLRSADPA